MAIKKQVIVEQNTQEWLDLRANYRTASEAPIVLGISPFKTPLQFKMEKLGLRRPYFSAAMKLGQDLEDAVREKANEAFGKNFVPQCWVRGKYMASLDGIDGDMLVEIKVSDRTFDDLAAKRAPSYYVAQVKQQLYCSPAERGVIFAYSPTKDKFAVSGWITLDDEFEQRMEAAWAAFDALELPEEVDLSDDGEVCNLFAEYRRIKQERDDLDNILAGIKDKLIERAQGCNVSAKGNKLTQRSGSASYDYKAAATDAGLDLEPYKKTREPSWTLSVAKPPFEVEE